MVKWVIEVTKLKSEAICYLQGPLEAAMVEATKIALLGNTYAHGMQGNQGC